MLFELIKGLIKDLDETNAEEVLSFPLCFFFRVVCSEKL